MILLVYKGHIYQDYKVHLLQILQPQMAIFPLNHLTEILQMEILLHLLQEVGEVLQILVEILMGLQVLVETLLPFPHLPVGEGQEVGHHHPLLRTTAYQLDFPVQIYHLSIIEAELLTPELLQKS